MLQKARNLFGKLSELNLPDRGASASQLASWPRFGGPRSGGHELLSALHPAVFRPGTLPVSDRAPYPGFYGFLCLATGPQRPGSPHWLDADPDPKARFFNYFILC